MATATRPRVKVRTGCLSCKARRVKCDESRPACRRCTISRRRCEGYTIVPNTTRTLAHSFTQSCTTLDVASDLRLDTGLSNALASDEHQWLEYFSAYTGPALSGNPENRSFWSAELLQMSLSEPAIRYALIAVSSCHARLEAQLSSAKYPHQIVGQDFTLKHYNSAIRSLRQAISLQSTKLHVPLICCLLFICMECLYGNIALTFTHLQNGLKILDSLSLPESSDFVLKSVTKMLKPIFDKFNAQSTVFGMPASLSREPPQSMDFIDAFAAKTALDSLINACMSFFKHMRIDYGKSECAADDPKRSLQRTLLDQLLAWGAQMESLERNDHPRVDGNDASVILLHVRQEATFVYVALSLDARQTFCDAFLPRFESITDLIERFMARSGGSSRAMPSLISSAFCLESSLIPALWLTVVSCREPTIRRRAISLLEAHPGREGLWDARLYAKAAKRVVQIEEASQPLQQLDSSCWPDEHFRVYRTDVHRTSEEPLRSARLVFHTAPNGYFGNKVIWSENITY